MKFSAEYPDQLGIGIDEETALIVKGDHIQDMDRVLSACTMGDAEPRAQSCSVAAIAMISLHESE